MAKYYYQKRKAFVQECHRHWTGIIGKFLSITTRSTKQKGEKMEILLDNAEAINQDTQELAKVLLARFGLLPRKKDGSAKLHTLLLQLYERKKEANRDKRPEAAVMPVEEMALHAGIKRQTMYDYLRRWLDLSILKKTSFVSNGKVIIGYELNGTNLEGSFRKAESTIKSHLDASFRVIELLQNEIKKEKLRSANGSSTSEEQASQQDSS